MPRNTRLDCERTIPHEVVLASMQKWHILGVLSLRFEKLVIHELYTRKRYDYVKDAYEVFKV